MALEYRDAWKCNIASDSMSASVIIEPPPQGIDLSVDDVVAFMREKGVVAGFLEDEIENIIRRRNYYREVEVARGMDPVSGIEGYYDFKFPIGAVKSPTIRPDGSVDYQSMSVVHSVRKGDLLCVYHHAVQGKHGFDVKGREMRCKPVKDLPEIRGTGFDVIIEGDLIKYVAVMEGRVDYDSNKMAIRDVLEHKGDLDLVTGRIDFRGDVIIHGSVLTGTVIRASKSITVEGSVEAATLIAEGDIVLKKGMQGGGKAKIVSGKNVYANFIEFATVEAKGNIESNILLNCRLKAGGNIKISGKRGSIVGGNTYAAGLIHSSNMGNMAEVKTVASVGMLPEVRKRLDMLNLKLATTKGAITSNTREIEKLKDVRINNDDPKEVREAKINQLLRKITRDTRVIEHIEKEIAEIVGNDGMRVNIIQVEEKVFPGVTVHINDEKVEIKTVAEHVEYYTSKGEKGVFSQPL